jgi:hypothetical protein
MSRATVDVTNYGQELTTTPQSSVILERFSLREGKLMFEEVENITQQAN